MDKWEDETLSNDNQNMHNSITLSGAKNKRLMHFSLAAKRLTGMYISFDIHTYLSCFKPVCALECIHIIYIYIYIRARRVSGPQEGRRHVPVWADHHWWGSCRLDLLGG